MKTKNGVYLDLTESDYKYFYGGLIFFFSSEFYKKKFETKIKEFINDETLKIVSKYNTKCTFELFFMISFYKKIEKRGFRIFDNVNKKELTQDVVITNEILLY